LLLLIGDPGILSGAAAPGICERFAKAGITRRRRGADSGVCPKGTLRLHLPLPVRGAWSWEELFGLRQGLVLAQIADQDKDFRTS